MTNIANNVLYTGSTSDLFIRVEEHKEKKFNNSFTSRYNIDKLVYYEFYEFIVEAIAREAQIKKMSRQKKIDLIEKNNPVWNDLTESLE